MQRFIRKSFAVSKKYTYLCGDSFHHASHLHSDQGGTFAFYNSIKRIFKEGAWIKDLEVLACDLEDNDIIIGMDTITRGDLAITNKDGETWFSFRIPSQEHIEFE